MKTIVVAVDKSENSLRAFDEALNWASKEDNIILFHVDQELFDPYYDELELKKGSKVKIMYENLCKDKGVIHK